MEEKSLGIYVVVAPSGDVFSSQVAAYDADDALYRCANICSNVKRRQAQAVQMEKEGWQVYSKLKWDFMQASKEPAKDE